MNKTMQTKKELNEALRNARENESYWFELSLVQTDLLAKTALSKLLFLGEKATLENYRELAQSIRFEKNTIDKSTQDQLDRCDKVIKTITKDLAERPLGASSGW